MSPLAVAFLMLLGAWSGPERLKAALQQEGRGDDGGAVRALEKLASEDPQWELPRLEAARLYLKSGTELARAKAHLEAALKLAPQNPRAHYLWGLVREEEGAKEQAVAALEQAVSLRPDYVEARFRLGGLHADRGNWARAEAHYRAVAELEHTATTARLQLAMAIEKQGRTDDAERELRRLWEEQPASVVVQRKLTEFYERTGQVEQAERVRSNDPAVRRKLRPLPASKR